MSINALYPIQFATPAVAPNGQMYTKTNAGKIIGGTVGAAVGLSSNPYSGPVPTAIDSVVMAAIGTGIGSAVDYLINKQREQIANSVSLNSPTPTLMVNA